MTEQWQELKETITEMRDNDGTGTQQEVCKFLVNYMNVLEKQMQEPILNRITAEIEEVQTYDGIYIDRAYVLDIIDKYREEQTDVT